MIREYIFGFLEWLLNPHVPRVPRVLMGLLIFILFLGALDLIGEAPRYLHKIGRRILFGEPRKVVTPADFDLYRPHR